MKGFKQLTTVGRHVRKSPRAVSVAASFSTPTRLYVPKHNFTEVFFMEGMVW
jgi:hypothetical protein